MGDWILGFSYCGELDTHSLGSSDYHAYSKSYKRRIKLNQKHLQIILFVGVFDFW